MNLEKPTDSHTPDPANPQFGSGANGYPSALPQRLQEFLCKPKNRPKLAIS